MSTCPTDNWIACRKQVPSGVASFSRRFRVHSKARVDMMTLHWWRLYGIVVSVAVALASAAWADPAEEAYQDGVRLAKEGLSKEAIAAFDKAIRLKPTYAEAYAARGSMHNRLVENERAIQDFNEAIRLNPKYI